jgi:hypothetical protein
MSWFGGDDKDRNKDRNSSSKSDWDVMDPFQNKDRPDSDSYSNNWETSVPDSRFEQEATEQRQTWDDSGHSNRDDRPDTDADDKRQFVDRNIMEEGANRNPDAATVPSNKPGANTSANKKNVQTKPVVGGLGYCGVVGVTSAISGGVAGAALNFVHTMHEGWQLGILKEPDFPRHLRSSMLQQGANFGGWLAVYGSVKCASTHIRKKNDGINSFIGGCCAGMTVTLQTRNPRTIIAAGLLNGSVMFVLDLFSSSQSH